MELRRAHGLDLTQLSQLLIGWLEDTEINYPGYCEYSPLWLADFIYRYPVFIVTENEKIIGSIGLKVNNFPWNDQEKCLFCDFLMIDKEYRNTNAVILLLEAAKKLSDELRLTLYLGSMTGSKADIKDRFFSINGFQYLGGNFIYLN